MRYVIRHDVQEQINAILVVQANYADTQGEFPTVEEHLKDIIAACEMLLTSLGDHKPAEASHATPAAPPKL